MAVSQIKAVELDFFSTLNCFGSCFLHSPVGDPFCERCNPFNNIDPLSETDVIQTNFVVIFEIIYCSLTRNERATKLHPADLGRVAASMTGMLLYKLTFSHIDYTRTRTLQLCFVSPNKIRIQFLFHSHSVVDYFKYC